MLERVYELGEIFKSLRELGGPNSLKINFKFHMAKAEPLFKRALTIFETALGPDHPNVATVCEHMAKCYKALDKNDEAEILERRARRIRSGQ